MKNGPLADALQILTMIGDGRVATKQFALENSKIVSTSYGMGKYFDCNAVQVEGLQDLSKALTGLEEQSTKFVIRGSLKNGVSPINVVRRSKGPMATFEACERKWLLIDIDELELPSKWSEFNKHVDEIVDHATNKLPLEFHGVDTHWQFSSSMGMKNGIRLHLWYWLSRSVSDQEAEAWVTEADTKIDRALYRAVQPHYTSAPVFGAGVSNPVTTRSGLKLFGKNRDTVSVPDDLSQRTKQSARSRRSSGSSPGLSISQEIIRDAHDIVIDGREKFLYLQSIEACKELTKGSSANKDRPTVDQIAKKTWELFSQSADLSDGKWIEADAREKAYYRHEELEDNWQPNGRYLTTTLVPDLPPYFEFDELSLIDGMRLLTDSLTGFFNDVGEGKTRRTALRVTMGLGKTTIAAQEINKLITVKPSLNIEIYTPRHDLAKEFTEKISDQTKLSVDVVHVYGRGQQDKAGKELCSNYEMVEAYENAGLSIYPNVCYQHDDEKCEYFDGCAYLNQFRPNEPGSVRIFPHNYLGLRRSNMLPEPDLIIIDEGFVGSLQQKHSVTSDDVRDYISDDNNPNAGSLIVDSLRNKKPLLAALRQNKMEPQWLRSLKFDHGENILSFGKDRLKTITRLKNKSYAKYRNLKSLCVILAEELEAHPDRDEVTRLRYDTHSQAVFLNQLADLPLPETASLLILDATADEQLLKHIIPDIEFERIDVVQNAFVTQVFDRTGSIVSWKNNEMKVDELEVVLRERAKGAGNVLCVSHKDLADKLRKMDFPASVSIDHFGNLRGTDQYKDCDTIVITGRNQPSNSDVDGMARAIWWDDDEPLDHDEAALLGAPTKVDLPTEPRGYLMSDPSEAAGVNVRCFRDQRIEAVHQQIRETETIQDIARLRLVRAEQIKHVFLLSNLPIEMNVDRLVEWNQLMPDKVELELLERGNIPLNPTGLEKMRPDLVSTSAQAKNYARHTRLSDLEGLTMFASTQDLLARVIVRFRTIREGKLFGKVRRHLFQVPLPDGAKLEDTKIVELTPDDWAELLANGYSDIPNSGWGPVKIIGFDNGPVPDHMTLLHSTTVVREFGVNKLIDT